MDITESIKNYFCNAREAARYGNIAATRDNLYKMLRTVHWLSKRIPEFAQRRRFARIWR